MTRLRYRLLPFVALAVGCATELAGPSDSGTDAGLSLDAHADAFAPADARIDAFAIDGGHDIDAFAIDGGHDIDAFAIDGGHDIDALTPDAWLSEPDAWVTEPDAFVAPDDAFIAPPDAFVPPDAYVAPDDAYVAPPDAWAECFTAADCDDGVACTTDDCVFNMCRHAAIDSVCSDGIDCTYDHCDLVAGCVIEPMDASCSDGIACTTDTCDPLLGCRRAPSHSTCAPGSYCDLTMDCTVAPTFSEVYAGILQARCGPCHTVSPFRGALDMSSEATAYGQLVGTIATCGAGANTRVIPGDSARSLLWRKVAGVDLCGSRMPRGGAPLTDAQIALIAQWIDAGALR